MIILTNQHTTHPYHNHHHNNTFIIPPPYDISYNITSVHLRPTIPMPTTPKPILPNITNFILRLLTIKPPKPFHIKTTHNQVTKTKALIQQSIHIKTPHNIKTTYKQTIVVETPMTHMNTHLTTYQANTFNPTMKQPI